VPSGWPAVLQLVRHGESVGNAASAAAAAAGAEVIDIDVRDADADLTPHGCEQALTLGHRLAALPPGERPEEAVISPYVRARHTAALALGQLGNAVPVTFDERLRDREMGVLDRLTARGIEVRHPDEAAARRRLGKFYHRPAGGESWADVLLRVRAVLGDLRSDHAGKRVLVVAHDVVVVLFRYLIEGLDEAAVLDISHQAAPSNCGITTYELDGTRGLVLRTYNSSTIPGESTRAADG
jgi:probable phosphoglycerate mutase